MSESDHINEEQCFCRVKKACTIFRAEEVCRIIFAISLVILFTVLLGFLL